MQQQMPYQQRNIRTTLRPPRLQSRPNAYVEPGDDCYKLTDVVTVVTVLTEKDTKHESWDHS